MSPLSSYQRAIQRQHREQRRLARRFRLADRVFRFARWLAAGFAGGAERERLGSDAGPIYEDPSRELLIFESINPLCADIRIFRGGTSHQVTLTREQVNKLSWRLYQWCDQWEQRGLRAEGPSLFPGSEELQHADLAKRGDLLVRRDMDESRRVHDEPNGRSL